MNWSLRALNILKNPSFRREEIPPSWFKCHLPDARSLGWAGHASVENWGYHGGWSEAEQVLLEALGQLLKNKSWEKITEISLREAEAWLRDRNSVPALPAEGLSVMEELWPRIQQEVVRSFKTKRVLSDYRFPSEKSFEKLSLSEKIRELKAFFSSDRLSGFYKSGGEIEVLDVEEFTLYVGLHSGSIPEGALLDWLQMTLAEVYREPRLNLIPEPLSR